MSHDLTTIRDLLMPGLMEIRYPYDALPPLFWGDLIVIDDPHYIAPVSLPAAIAMGAAAVVIRNPTVSRRDLFRGGLA